MKVESNHKVTASVLVGTGLSVRKAGQYLIIEASSTHSVDNAAAKIVHLGNRIVAETNVVTK